MDRNIPPIPGPNAPLTAIALYGEYPNCLQMTFEYVEMSPYCPQMVPHRPL